MNEHNTNTVLKILTCGKCSEVLNQATLAQKNQPLNKIYAYMLSYRELAGSEDQYNLFICQFAANSWAVSWAKR